MRSFLVEHVGPLIDIALGLLLTVYAWRRRGQVRLIPKRVVRALRVFGPLIVGCGVLRLLLGLLMPLDQPARWQRTYTGDRVASAEFPYATITETITNSGHGFPVLVSNVKCNLPHRDINLLLSCNEFPPGNASPTIAQFLEASHANMRALGFNVVSSGPDTNGVFPGCRLVLEADQGKTRCVMRVAITPKAVYRALATSAAGLHDDPAITRFLDSFTTTQTTVDLLIRSILNEHGGSNGASVP